MLPLAGWSQNRRALRQASHFFFTSRLPRPIILSAHCRSSGGKGECGGYGEFVIETDHHVGRILSYLKTSGLDQNTMVILTSDNGPENSWKNRVTEFNHQSNGDYRGGKRDIYEGGHRVPFFIRWPDGIKNPGRTANELVGQVDILATIAELIGAELPANAGEDSQSFASLLTQPETVHHRVPLINHSASGRFSITDGDWKLILPHRKRKRELYQLALDPSEQNDVLLENPAIAPAPRKQNYRNRLSGSIYTRFCGNPTIQVIGKT